MRNVKIRVTNEAQSKYVQEVVIASGGRWASGDVKSILRESYTDNVIGVDDRGIMSLWGARAHFDLEVESVTSHKFVDNRPKIVFQGRTYIVADVERAIEDAGVEPL